MNRRQEEVREVTLKNLGREKMLESNMNREQRLEDKRFLRQQMTEQKEREMEETMLKVTTLCIEHNFIYLLEIL